MIDDINGHAAALSCLKRCSRRAVTEHRDIGTGEQEILAVGRLRKIDAADAQLAVLITDEYQGLGLGTELSRKLLENCGR
jgi:hypothetical protein